MKKNIVVIGRLILKLGYTCTKAEYYTATVKLGKVGSWVVVKICEIVRVDSRNNCTRISMRNGSFIADYRCMKDVALLLPYNHFGYYRKGCIFCMYCVLGNDTVLMSVMLDNSSEVVIGTRIVFKRFEDDFFELKT